MIYLPFLSALGLAGGTILEKIVLKKRKVGIKLYQTASFFAISVLMIPLLFFYWKLTPEAIQTKNIFIFSLVIIFSIIANLFVFYSLKWEKVTTLQPARISEPLMVVILSVILSFIFTEYYERNLNILIPTLIAGLALVLSNVKKSKLVFNKYILAAIAGSFFFATELVISKLILDFYSPITFYFLRCSTIFIISLIIFRPKIKVLDKKTSSLILLTGALWVVYRVLIYYGFQSLGVIFTMLIIMLGPVFVYLFAFIFLKEKMSIQNIIASIIVLASVLYVVV